VYTALTFSEWHPGYSHKVHELARRGIPGTKSGAYFSMCSLPVQSEPGGNYQFIGQGGRALAYRSTWAEHLMSQQVSMFWDVWIINQLSQQRRYWEKKKLGCKHPSHGLHPKHFRAHPRHEQTISGLRKIIGSRSKPRRRRRVLHLFRLIRQVGHMQPASNDRTHASILQLASTWVVHSVDIQ